MKQNPQAHALLIQYFCPQLDGPQLHRTSLAGRTTKLRISGIPI